MGLGDPYRALGGGAGGRLGPLGGLSGRGSGVYHGD